MKHVLIPTKLDTVAGELLTAKGFTVVQDADTPMADLIAAHPETQVLIVRSDKVTAAVIDALPELKLVVRAGSGYNTIDTKHARRRGVDVMNTPGANANAVAEEVLAVMLAYCRHIIEADATTRQGLWEKKRLMGRELAGKTIGIVGLGNIGQLVVKRLSGFEVKVLGYDPLVPPKRAQELGVRTVSLRELFSESDFVTLHVPETDETRGMVNRSLLECMKEGAVLVNCARAGVVVEDDLRAVRKELGRPVFLNDVYPADAAGEKSVADIADIMLPHLGASTYEANTNAARRAAEQVIAYAERGVNKYVVNKALPDELDEAYQQLAYHIAFIARRWLGTEMCVRRIECSFYGDLHPFAKWFLAPILAGVSADFDALGGPQEAEEYLASKGIALEIRETADQTSYDSSMTIDLFEGDDLIRQVSIRGTIAEGKLMISRINDFEDLYFQPHGNSLIVLYRDRPGVLARITAAVADAGINIDDIRSPHDSTAVNSLAVLKTNEPVLRETVDRIKQETGAQVVVAIALP